MKSWKTTIWGILTILGALVSVAVALIDDDPSTNPNWELTVTTIMAGIGLIFSKDFNKTGI